MLSAALSQAQYFRVTGKVINDKMEPLPFVSVRIKGAVSASVSKEDGTYELKLEEGKYELLFTMVGYKPHIITLVVTRDYVQNIIMQEEDKSLDEAIVRSKTKDRSTEIIRNVIRHKDELLAAAGAYSAAVYIKATQEDSSALKRKKTRVLDSLTGKSLANELNKMAMAEIVLRYDRENKKEKEERTGVVKRGDPQSLFFLSVTAGDFNLYNNLLYARTLSAVPFLSPLSYSGLAAYKYKIVSTNQRGKHKQYVISVKPRQLSNVTVEGELTILDSAWVITAAKFTLPSYHLPEYDFFEVDQQYEFVNNTAWMLSRQEFRYFSKHGKGRLNGRTVVSFSGFELNKKFPARHFGTELSATVQQAYERDSLFWESSRTEPLTKKEVRFIQYKDSVYRATHTKAYLDSIDAQTNKVTWKKILLSGQTLYNREKERSWYIPPILSIYEPFQFGGGRIRLSTVYSKISKSKKTLNVSTVASYGIRNRDINGTFKVVRMYNPFNRAFYRIEATRRFQYIFEGDAWINLLRRNNQYLDNKLGIGHGQEILNGLFLYSDLDFALRRSLVNYKTNPDIDTLFNWINNNQPIAFDPYNALYGKLRLAYTHRQKYIREPGEKIILGSKWPTIYIEWRKGIPGVWRSKIDFDYLEIGVEQELKLGTTGISKYNVKSGSFLNTNELQVVDYKFQRRGDPVLFMNPHDAFQSLDSTFPLFKRFYQGHYVHEFNGSIINKVPLLKKLRIKEIAGAGFLVAPERNLRYGEIFFGIERAFKWPFDPLQRFKIGIYLVSSAANRLSNPIQIKFGITSWDRSRDRWY